MEAPRFSSSSSRTAPRFTSAQAVACGLLVAAMGWGAWLLRDRPLNEEVELLPGTVLPSSELAIVEAAFDRAQLTDHRTEDGRVWVPRTRQSSYMRALVDAEALPREFGSSLRRALEKNSPWQSRTVQEEMLRVAKQEELQDVICSMPGIERAAVLYDVEEQTGLGGGIAVGPIRTASVNIRSQPDAELEPARVQAIRVLVAASIAGLTPERVAVTDLRSGQHYAGPLDAVETQADDFAAADPELSRRVAHERHLAGKIRQAIAFVKGAIVDVTVSFPSPPPQIPALPPPAPERERPIGWRQRVADANAPAEITPPESAPSRQPAAAVPPEPADPASICVSIAVPESYFQAVARAEQERNPTADAAACEARERDRIRGHVLQLLPSGGGVESREVVITSFPTPGTRTVRRSQPPRLTDASPADHPPMAGGPPSRGEPRTPGQIVDAACEAVAAGRMQDVPREAWVVAMAACAAVLALLVLRGGAAAVRSTSRPRRSQPRIDWSAVEAGGSATAAAAGDDVAFQPHSRKVAA